MGTLSEYTIAFEENKPIGVLTHTKGIAYHLEEITKKCEKQRDLPVLFDNEINKLVERLIKQIPQNN